MATKKGLKLWLTLEKLQLVLGALQSGGLLVGRVGQSVAVGLEIALQLRPELSSSSSNTPASAVSPGPKPKVLSLADVGAQLSEAADSQVDSDPAFPYTSIGRYVDLAIYLNTLQPQYWPAVSSMETILKEVDRMRERVADLIPPM